MLIDAVVRQTTVLIAQLATSGGSRAPLTHVANQVFFDLVQALEGQGLGKKVVADMFGMALRSYQQKVQRISESATDRGASLWEAIYRFMQGRDVASRDEILAHFRYDDEASIRSILHDLVESGLLYRSGRGTKTVYRVTPEADIQRASADGTAASLAALVWLNIYRHAPITEERLLEQTPSEPLLLQAALRELVRDGRVRTLDLDGQVAYSADQCLIPLGSQAGWEVGLFDHFQAVVTSICLKLQNGATRALPSDQIGGSTFRFDVWPGHPHEDEVKGLLSRHRKELGTLWDRVSAHSEAQPTPRDKQRVTFYFGQSIREEPGAPLAREHKP
jgi:hypothetical protein